MLEWVLVSRVLVKFLIISFLRGVVLVCSECWIFFTVDLSYESVLLSVGLGRDIVSFSELV